MAKTNKSTTAVTYVESIKQEILALQQHQDAQMKALLDKLKVAEQAASAARANAERHNKYAQRLVGKLREVYEKITKEEDEGEIEALEEEAAELAESLEIEFVYVRADGTERKYTPQVFWEPSGGCEWEESAQYGYHYGWDI